MIKEVIHSHNFAVPRLHFSYSSSLSVFFSLVSSYWILFSFSPACLFNRKSHLVDGKPAQASCLLRAEGTSSPYRVICKIFSPCELGASLGELGVRNLCEMTILLFFLALFGIQKKPSKPTKWSFHKDF